VFIKLNDKIHVYDRLSKNKALTKLVYSE